MHSTELRFVVAVRFCSCCTRYRVTFCGCCAKYRVTFCPVSYIFLSSAYLFKNFHPDSRHAKMKRSITLAKTYDCEKILGQYMGLSTQKMNYHFMTWQSLCYLGEQVVCQWWRGQQEQEWGKILKRLDG